MKKIIARSLLLSAVVAIGVCALGSVASAQSPTPTITGTSTPTLTPTLTFTRTPTNTPTNTPTISPTSSPSSTPTISPTRTATSTPNDSLTSGAKLLTETRLRNLSDYSPGAAVSTGDLREFLRNSSRNFCIRATNATRFNRSDIGEVVEVRSYVATGGSAGAPSTQMRKFKGADYTVANGDMTPVGDHSTEEWCVTYRPYSP